jgi:outer membrane protein TolC
VSSVVGDLELEAERGRDDGEWENGIGAGVQLPIFNWGGGARQAAGARLDALVEQRIADRVRLRAEARRLVGELEAAREAALFQRSEVLPLAGQVMQGAQLDYNAMQIGVFALLDAKRAQLAAGRNYVSALRNYWALKARYDQMMAGGSIGDFAPSRSADSAGTGQRGDH